MRKVIIILAAVMVIMAGSLSRAQAWYLVPSGSGTDWQGYTTADNSGTPYWNHTGGETPSNSGAYVLGQVPLNSAQWLGKADGLADLNLQFHDGTVGDELKLEVAGLAGVNAFGWYTVSGTTITYHQLFKGTDTAGKTATFYPGDTVFGFYLLTDNKNTNGVPDAGENVWYTQSSLNAGTDTGLQHFAFFRNANDSTSFWIGCEDLPWSSSDKDYQDMIVKITFDSPQVPLPGTFLLLGSGLVGLAGFARRRKSLVA